MLRATIRATRLARQNAWARQPWRPLATKAEQDAKFRETAEALDIGAIEAAAQAVPLGRKVPLNEQFGVPPPPSTTKVDKTVRHTTLDNGVRVVSVDSHQPVSSVGVFLDAGSVWEQPDQAGSTLFLQSMAFKSTQSMSEVAVYNAAVQLGNVQAKSQRETVAYVADVLRSDVPAAMQIFSGAINTPAFKPAEVEALKKTMAVPEHPDVMDAAFALAYGAESPLGMPLVASKEALDAITPATLQSYVDSLYTAKRTVVAGVGISHDALVEQTVAQFGDMRSGAVVTKKASPYVGGTERMHVVDEGNSDGDAHVVLAYECAGSSASMSDMVATIVLKRILGGGSSFSAGGPGKGMYSRLYTGLLRRHGWVSSASSFVQFFGESSLFGFYATCAPAHVEQLVSQLKEEATAMAGSVDTAELSRAKNSIKSGVLIDLESRSVACEDLASQVHTYGKVMSDSEIAALIDGVTAADIQRVATQMLATTPTLLYYGDMTQSQN